MKYLNKLLNLNKTVFSYQDLQLILGIDNKNTIKSFLARGVKTGIFQNVTKGIYTLQKFDLWELAVKLKTNSYLSLETVLKKEGIIFQDYGDNLFLVSNQSIQKRFKDITFKYLKIKNSILMNPLWIVNQGNYSIATVERAICDCLYLSPNYYFDNLENINFQRLQKISLIYNQRVIKQIEQLIIENQ